MENQIDPFAKDKVIKLESNNEQDFSITAKIKILISAINRIILKLIENVYK